jgi:hypothetical protein
MSHWHEGQATEIDSEYSVERSGTEAPEHETWQHIDESESWGHGNAQSRTS